MFSETLIRPAISNDSEAIARLMATGVSDVVRRITIMGSPQLAHFIADEIGTNGGDEYVVGTVQERVVGMSSWRHTGTTLQLNHLYLATDVRGHGMGTALVLDGLHRVRQTREQQLSLDNFSDNPHARAWYESWNMRSEREVQWIQQSLPPLDHANFHCTIAGLSAADRRHQRYGFSQIILETSLARYQIGRLGPGLFRAGTCAILQDAAALQGLRRLDGERQLLCLHSAGDCAELASGTATLVAESARLVAPCADVIEYLEASLLRRRLVLPASVVSL